MLQVLFSARTEIPFLKQAYFFSRAFFKTDRNFFSVTLFFSMDWISAKAEPFSTIPLISFQKDLFRKLSRANSVKSPSKGVIN